MNKITQYNQLIESIVWDWYVRYSKELYEQEENELYKTDFRIIEYQGINQWPVECNDRFFSLDDILMCELHNISCKYLQDYYDESLEAHMEWKDFFINFYNYALQNINPKRYKQNQDRELKESENKVKLAKKELKELLK